MAEEKKDDGKSFLNKFDDYLKQKGALPIAQQRVYAIASQQHIHTERYRKPGVKNNSSQGELIIQLIQ